MKFFYKTLDEIYDIVSEVNDMIFNKVNSENEFPSISVSFEFSEHWALFKLDDFTLFSTENNDQLWIDETDEPEDIKLTLIRAINERISIYKKVELNADKN